MTASDRKLVIFDCDGTLVDSQVPIVQAMSRAFERSSLAVPGRRAILSIVGLSLHEAMRALAPDQPTEIRRQLTEGYETAFAEIMSDGDRRESLYDGAAEIVKTLSAHDDVALGIATGKSRRGTWRVLDAYDLRHCFVTIRTADDAPSKPHPEMILQAMSEVGVEARDTAMVGDTTYDIQMAQAAGVASVGVDWGYHSKARLDACGPDVVISDFGQLSGILDMLWKRSGTTA